MDISQASCCGCGRDMRITQVRCPQCDVSMEGEFEISPFARLSLEDQLFVAAFVRHHGSIKKMEGLFGISYPTVKNRLNAIICRIDKNFEAQTRRLRERAKEEGEAREKNEQTQWLMPLDQPPTR